MFDRLYPYYCGAGRGARAKYLEVSGRWRRRVFRRPWMILGALCTPVVVVAVLDREHWWLWFLGVLLGAVISAYVALLESPPGHIENWRTGFEGERRTARALAPLRRHGYRLLHDLPDRRILDHEYRGNIDHVVVCPAGVFLLDSKWLGGEASIAGDTVHVQMQDDDDGSYEIPRLAGGMRGRAVRLQEDIRRHAQVRFVRPVVVLWNDFPQGLVSGDKVVFVHGDRLVGWLQQQEPTTMTPDMVDQVAAGINLARPTEQGRWRKWLGRLGASIPATASLATKTVDPER